MNDDVFDKVMARAAEARERPVVVPINTQANGGQPAAEGEPETLLDRYRSRLIGAKALTERPPPPHLVDGLLYCNTMAVLYGKPDSYKSFVALDWSLCLAAGLSWNGREVAGGPVLYVSGEGSGGVGKRVQAWLDRTRLDDVAGFELLPEVVSLLDAAQTHALATLAKELGAVLVVIDTLGRSMVGGDENSAQDMGQAVEGADQVRRQSGATVLLIHHSNRAGTGYRGSSALEGAADTMVEAEASGKPGARRVTLTTLKQKDAERERPIELAVRVAEVTVGGEVATSCVLVSQSAAESTPSEEQLLSVLSEHMDELGLSGGDLKKLANMPEASFYRARKALLKRGVLVNVGGDKRPHFKLATGGSIKDSQSQSETRPNSHSEGGSLGTPPSESERELGATQRSGQPDSGPPVEDIPPPSEPMGGEEP